MWLLDFPTLILIIAAGLQVGLQATFGLDVIGKLFGDYERVVLMLMGVSALWQFSRQRFL